jgi:hypothetical protein
MPASGMARLWHPRQRQRQRQHQPTNKESNQNVSEANGSPQSGRRLQQEGAKEANQERKYTEQVNTVRTSRLPNHQIRQKNAFGFGDCVIIVS